MYEYLLLKLDWFSCLQQKSICCLRLHTWVVFKNRNPFFLSCFLGSFWPWGTSWDSGDFQISKDRQRCGFLALAAMAAGADFEISRLSRPSLAHLSGFQEQKSFLSCFLGNFRPWGIYRDSWDFSVLPKDRIWEDSLLIL